MSIARAVLEYCAGKKLGAKTLFATHYHELTVLEGQLPGVKNYNIAAKKKKTTSSSSGRSFGAELTSPTASRWPSWPVCRSR